MALTRANAVSYLTGMYGSGDGNLLGQASIPTTDTVGGLKEPIDQAVLLVGGSYDALSADIETADVPTFLAALNYTTLRRILGGLNSLLTMDVGAGEGVTLKGSQLIAKVQKLLEVAAAELTGLGVNVGSGGAMWPGVTHYNMDYLEPMEEYGE